jgi:hypothetical protein
MFGIAAHAAIDAPRRHSPIPSVFRTPDIVAQDPHGFLQRSRAFALAAMCHSVSDIVNLRALVCRFATARVSSMPLWRNFGLIDFLCPGRAIQIHAKAFLVKFSQAQQYKPARMSDYAPGAAKNSINIASTRP